MKKQLQLLKSMELDGSESDPIGEKTVLKLLKEKSRRLETESIQLKVRHPSSSSLLSLALNELRCAPHGEQARGKQLEEELARTKQELESAEEKLKDQSLLISRLEEDITSAHRAGPPPVQSAPAAEERSTPSVSASDDISTVTEIIRSQRYALQPLVYLCVRAPLSSRLLVTFSPSDPLCLRRFFQRSLQDASK
jgi:hypothetical protein